MMTYKICCIFSVQKKNLTYISSVKVGRPSGHVEQSGLCGLESRIKDTDREKERKK